MKPSLSYLHCDLFWNMVSSTSSLIRIQVTRNTNPSLQHLQKKIMHQIRIRSRIHFFATVVVLSCIQIHLSFAFYHFRSHTALLPRQDQKKKEMNSFVGKASNPEQRQLMWPMWSVYNLGNTARMIQSFTKFSLLMKPRDGDSGGSCGRVSDHGSKRPWLISTWSFLIK